MHETAWRGRSTLLLPSIYALRGIGHIVAGLSTKEERTKLKKLTEDNFKECKERTDEIERTKIEIFYPPICEPTIGTIEDALSNLDLITKEKSDAKEWGFLSALVGNLLNTPHYCVEILTDWGDWGEELFLETEKGRFFYPISSATTFLNRTFRRKRIETSRILGAENGNATIKTILETHLRYA